MCARKLKYMRIRNKKKKDPYQLLAETLRRIPQGFNIDEGGVWLKVLKWIFNPEEAKLASQMKLISETPKKMASRLKLDVEYLDKILKVMDKKGQIIEYKSSDGIKYGLMPFVVGIYEEQVDRMDADFAALMEEYFEVTGYSDLFDTEPEIFKIVPVNKVIPVETSIFPYQQAEEIVKKAKSWGIRDCICKLQQELIGNKCNYSKNVCLTFSKRENAYDDSTISKPISLDQAIQVLKDAEEEGLIHSSMNVSQGHNYICNCCTCCCGVMRSMVEFGQTRAFAKSDYEIEINEDECIACEVCVDRCQFNALTVDEVCHVDLDKCVGCGVCAVVCDVGAMKLVLRKKIKKPTRNMITWMLKKAWKRKVNPYRVFR